jgi:hypothetical protein
MEKTENEKFNEKPRWLKPEIATEEITTEFVVLTHCSQEGECGQSPVTP